MGKRKIIIKTDQQIKNIRESGKYLTELLYILKDFVKSGVNLLDIEAKAQQFIDKYWLKWAFKGYYWYPANLCLSVNDCVVHWIPYDYKLKEGDLLKIDAWINYNWGITDAAISIVVWWDDTNLQASKLYKVTKKALDEWIKTIRPWKKISLYAEKVFEIVVNNGFNIIRNLTWHGVGTDVHEAPYIYNYPHPELKKIQRKPGMVVALEPITAISSFEAIEKPWIPWNMYTSKWDLWAQWEYTVLITDNWYEVLAGIV